MPLDVTVEVECHFCGQSRTETVQVSEDQVEQILTGELDDYSVAFDSGGEQAVCDYPIGEDGERRCSREVENPGDRCWQHINEE